MMEILTSVEEMSYSMLPSEIDNGKMLAKQSEFTNLQHIKDIDIVIQLNSFFMK